MDLKKYKKKRIVPRGWKEITIGDVFRTSSGATPLSTEVSYYANGTIPWINSGELDNPYIYDTTNFISQKGFENSSTEIYPIDTVLVAMYGATAGKASILKMEACTNQAVCAILPNKEYSSIFLKYSIDTLYDHLVGLSSGSARDNLSQTELKKLKLIMPVTKREQDNIVSILSLIDRKIELNRLINQNLEAMAKQLYDYWFVQFDFPNEEGKPYKSSGEVMVYNERLGREIPQGWSTMPISEILDKYPTTKRYETKEYLSCGKYPIIDQSDSYIAGFTNEIDHLLTRHPAVLFGDHSTKVKFLDFDFARGADGTQILYSSNKAVSQYYLYLAVSALQIPNPGYSRHFKYLKELPIIIPDLKIANKFKNIVKPLFEEWTKNIFCNIELTKQSNELLPLLMNGQVSVNSDLSAY